MKRKVIILTAILVLLQLCCGSLWALPTTAYQAEKVVAGWLKADMQPLGTRLGQQIINVETFSDVDGEPIYYVVYLQPSGFVVVPADDLVEPIIAFADDGTFDPSLDNPLGALVSLDMRNRIAATKHLQVLPAGQSLTKFEAAFETADVKAQNKWAKLLNYAEEETPEPIIVPLNGDELREAPRSSQSSELAGLGTLSDVRVAPLVQSRWDQESVCGYYCYNYYTYDSYTSTYYPCGCVATAMAQLMRFHEYPTSGIGIHYFTVTYDGAPSTEPTLGGDGLGGAYNWGLMDLEPDCSTTEAQREAIGALCYDAAISINTIFESGGSSASVDKVLVSLRDYFGYNNAIDGYNWGSNIGAGLNGMINPNLDARYPVLLSIYGLSGSGHAVVCDGYGYNSSTLYHHLNMGYEGTDDAWYALPLVNASSYYNSIEGCAYNIYISGSGEIISGRVTNMSGNAISGATVTAQRVGGSTYDATTNSNGIYALAKVPSASQYTVSVTKAGYNFTAQTVMTGTSVDDEDTSGNCWGIDFEEAGVNHEPQLNNGLVTPDSGDANTDFYWCVDYYDEDGDSPANIRVYIDGNPYDMSLAFGTAANGTYYYVSNLFAGTHNYSFGAVDTRGGIATTPTYSGPVVEGASDIIAIQKCTANAGKTAGEDGIRVSGIIDVNADEFANADEIYVEIWSDSDDDLVYRESIDRRLFSGKKGRYSHRYRVRRGEPGAITLFKFDLNKHNFSLQAKDINLTGLGCPLSVEIEIGDYYGVGQADEDIVNGKRPIPIQFMMGVKNILRVDKAKVKFGKKDNTDSLSVNGVFTVEDVEAFENGINNGDPIVVTLGSQNFTLPGNEFERKENAWLCRNVDIGSSFASAKYDFAKCTFIINIKKTNVTDYGLVDFRIDFFGTDVLSLEKIDLGPKRSYGLEELRRYDVLGAWWDHNANYTIKGAGLNERGSADATISVSSSTKWVDGHECSVVNASSEGANMSSCWYTDADGTHQMGWGSIAELGGFEITIDSLIVAPAVLRIGQQYTDSGSFEGTYDIDSPYIDIDGFRGQIISTYKLVGHEQVSVPAGSFEAVKGTQKLELINCTMYLIYDDPYDHFEGTVKFSATGNQTWWGVPGVGIVKSITSMTIKMSAKGMGSASVKITETDVLTDYGD